MLALFFLPFIILVFLSWLIQLCIISIIIVVVVAGRCFILDPTPLRRKRHTHMLPIFLKWVLLKWMLLELLFLQFMFLT